MDFKEMTETWTAGEIRGMIKQASLNIVRERNGTPEMEEEICRVIDRMSDQELYERSFESYISLN